MNDNRCMTMIRQIRTTSKNILLIGAIYDVKLGNNIIEVNSSCEVKYYNKSLSYDLIITNNYIDSNLLDEIFITLKVNKVIALKKNSILEEIVRSYSKNVIYMNEYQIIKYINEK